MSNTVLQIPMTMNLRNQALSVAKGKGFSSLQELVRVFLTQITEQKVDVSFHETPLVLSDKNNKKYSTMIDEVESGKVRAKSFKNTKDLLDHLNE